MTFREAGVSTLWLSVGSAMSGSQTSTIQAADGEAPCSGSGFTGEDTTRRGTVG
jgi:hypothetical protein